MPMIRSLAVAAALLLAASGTAAADAQTFKIATLAPAGSSWMKLFEKWKKNVERRTDGRVKIKFFPGGQQGDERDFVRKIRAGQLQGAAVTGVGLGLINPEVRLLDLPFMFKTDEELDHVRSTLSGEFEKKFEEKDFILLGWGDVGWTYLFSNTEIRGRGDLDNVKMWAWTDDPIVKKFFEMLHLKNSVPLGVPDVLPALQTGQINACYGSPLAAVALQWHTKVKFMTGTPLSMAVGAFVVSKKDFDKASEADRAILKEEAKSMEKALITRIRKDNASALKTMKDNGLVVVDSPPAMQKDFEGEARKVWVALAGSMYPNEFLERVKGLVAQKRK
jgi:TRAP-type C4-dicarboxylate transport system substrate-binding protein